MCGLGGFVNVPDYATRLALVRALGEGIDTRGGDAIGYVTVPRAGPPSVDYARRAGEWGDDDARRFLRSAARNDGATILHARYATCGDRDNPMQAHPFRIEREGRTVLWGAHNGVIHGAEASARVHGRSFDVDSRELYELLADGQYEKIRALRGWGVLSWIESAHRDRVSLVCMTDDGALRITRTTCGAVVWASTQSILDASLRAAGMTPKDCWRQRGPDEKEGFDVGKVMHVYSDGRLAYAGGEDITLQEYTKAEYRADRRATTYYEPSYGGDWSSDEWERFRATLAKYEDDDDPADEWGDPGVCPICKSADTYVFALRGCCADCGTEWSMATATATAAPGAANDGTDDVTEASDGWNVARWDEYVERMRKRDRDEREARASTALVRIAGKGTH